MYFGPKIMEENLVYIPLSCSHFKHGNFGGALCFLLQQEPLRFNADEKADVVMAEAGIVRLEKLVEERRRIWVVRDRA